MSFIKNKILTLTLFCSNTLIFKGGLWEVSVTFHLSQMVTNVPKDYILISLLRLSYDRHLLTSLKKNAINFWIIYTSLQMGHMNFTVNQIRLVFLIAWPHYEMVLEIVLSRFINTRVHGTGRTCNLWWNDKGLDFFIGNYSK